MVVGNGRAVVHGQVGYGAFVHHGFLICWRIVGSFGGRVFVAGFTAFIKFMDGHGWFLS